ncbi:MAG: hypothetical protein ACRYFZ_09790 [Janthinobacterium lividum]
MPDFLNNTDTLRGIVYTLCFVVFLLFGLFLLAKLRYSSLKLRKPALYVAFLLLGVAFLFGQPLFTWLAELAYGVHDMPGAVNASSEAIEAHAKVGGWVPVGTASSKIILAASFYVLTYILPWIVQQVTHPAPTEWSKDGYSTEFTSLPAVEKFQLIGRLSLNQSIRMAASILGACLIQ